MIYLIVGIIFSIVIYICYKWFFEWYNLYLDYVAEDVINHNESFLNWMKFQLFAETVYIDDEDNLLDISKCTHEYALRGQCMDCTEDGV